jgi:uncharacterized protein
VTVRANPKPIAGRRLLVLTGGHSIDERAFDALLRALAVTAGWSVERDEQGDGSVWLDGRAGQADAILLYDVPGLHLQRGRLPEIQGPTFQVVDAIAELLERGTGLVALHHAIAGWPGWPGWGTALGGRFHYLPGHFAGRDWPTSGYLHDRFTVDVVDASHPVTQGLPSFDVDDELYCAAVLDTEVQPLLRVADPRPFGAFAPSLDAVLGSTPDDTWHHPAPSDLLGWTHIAGTSPVVALLPGDRGSTLMHPVFRQMLTNALDWVRSDETRAHAADHRRPVDRARPGTSAVSA